ncbi:FkbM family methyltransferase [Agrobacterium sp. ES01]|uniref:FkbM family methyltransferase n=1 Tax=Agrobacterium sp. ES01 TaxID=3420714 RepID=UPI003D12DC79
MKAQPPFPSLKQSTAQLHQDSWVVHETNEKKGGFFVEIGAFDGISLSNTYILEKDFGWNGILVEPNPTHTIPILSRRKASLCTQPIDKVTGTNVTMRFLINTPELSSLSSASQKDMHAAHRRKDYVEIEMPSLNVNELLEKNAAPMIIDYMSIDTEGNELDILNSFDFETYKVSLFSVEHNFTEDEVKIDSILFENGYERVHRDFSNFDAWYRRENS